MATTKIVHFDASDIVAASAQLTALAPSSANLQFIWTNGGETYVAEVIPQ